MLRSMEGMIMALQEGKKAPDFSLPATDGNEFKLSDYRGKKKVVVYFYPKDDTPGCTKEACDFRDSIKKFEKEDAVIVGISADSLDSHETFRKKFKLPFSLLSDTKRQVIEKYGVWKEKSMYGKKYMGIERTTVVIDKEGKIKKVFPKVKVDKHDEAVLEALATL